MFLLLIFDITILQPIVANIVAQLHIHSHQ